jgi:hypothetical protein
VRGLARFRAVTDPLRFGSLGCKRQVPIGGRLESNKLLATAMVHSS